MGASVIALLLAAADFSLVTVVDDLRVEARKVEDSSFPELRLSTTTRTPVRALCDAAFGDGKVPPGDPYLKARTVLSESASERVTYDRVAAPLVARRDYALRTRRSESDGACQVSFELANELAPRPLPGWVRLTRLQGSWSFSRKGGLTEVIYVSHAEPGGDVPAFLAERPQRNTTIDLVRRLLARAAR